MFIVLCANAEHDRRMSQRRVFPLARAALLAAGLALLTAGSASAEPGPALTVTSAEVDQAFECSGPLENLRRDPVLLTPAFSTAKQSYSWNYRRQLPAAGITTCSLNLPDHGFGDLQRSAEYVVQAVRRMSAARGGGKVALLGHQHGALDELWAIRFWPDIAGMVSDYISLATPYRGTTLAAGCRMIGSCPSSSWQIATGSKFLAALTRDPLPAGPGYTSIATAYDELIVPQPSASRLNGATNVTLQSICPLRPIEHFSILADNLAYRLVLDALSRPGPAIPSRISRAWCLGPLYMPGSKIENLPAIAALGASALSGASTYGDQNMTKTEPPLRDYASASEVAAQA